MVLTSLIMSASFFSSSMLTSHAEENQTKIFGDINGDGIIDGRDATTLLPSPTYYCFHILRSVPPIAYAAAHVFPLL